MVQQLGHSLLASVRINFSLQINAFCTTGRTSRHRACLLTDISKVYIFKDAFASSQKRCKGQSQQLEEGSFWQAQGMQKFCQTGFSWPTLSVQLWFTHTHTHTLTPTTQNWAHGSDNEPANLANQIQVDHVARVTNTQSQNQNDHSGENIQNAVFSCLERKREEKTLERSLG